LALEVHGRDVEVTPHLADRIARGLRPAFDELRTVVERVVVRLESPRGVETRCCHVFVGLRPSGGVVVQDVAPSLSSAIDAALARTLAALRREARRRAAGPVRPAYAAME